MKPMTLKDIQQVSLEILKEVHSFCMENGIQYSLAYGTLLGAIRHKGFIPWDDDIDLYMTRPNYERFIKTFGTRKNLKLIAGQESYIAFARICDTEQTTTQTVLPWTKVKGTGIWIDLFPIDPIDDDKAVYQDKLKEALRLYETQLAARRATPEIPWKKGFKSAFKQICRKVKYRNLDIAIINDRLNKLCTAKASETTTHCTQLACPDEKCIEHLPIAFFEDYTDIEFEGHQFKAIKQWDRCLSELYGDYMQLPPEEERRQHSCNHTQFYWKTK
ncbi:LicD family protein [Fibrobacter sp.]|uniref:LicD family protein n=1 Tax=Fibrobacter sp. TaxID=35828 RepID=UPI002603E147|nr:LicD family protein [Fibrobacter sp.]MDD5941152.1 LicD family protein [Fibrobacter sp.]